jgi:hypothetical protein
MRGITLIIVLGVLYLPLNAEVNVIRSDQKGVEIEIVSSEPAISKCLIDGKEYNQVTIDGLCNTISTGEPSLPQKSFMVVLPPNTYPEIVSVQKVSQVSFKARPTPNLWTDDEGHKALPSKQIYSGSEKYPLKDVSVSPIAWIGSKKVVTVTVYPVLFDPLQNIIIFSSKIRVSINFISRKCGDILSPGGKGNVNRLGEILKGIVLNSAESKEWDCYPASSIATKNNDVSSDTLPYKIMVNKDGIYRITYYDLINAGIDPEKYDPKRIRIFNRNTETPLYFKGQADGFFNRDDYFEFYGEMNRGDSSFYNQFSDLNVYYLCFSNELGSRMIEEDGSLLSTIVARPNHYMEKLHFEKDSIIYKLDMPNSDQNDRWFWQRLDHPDSAVFKFNIPAPYNSGANYSKFKGSIHGVTTGSHLIQISINNNTIISSEWSGQTLDTFSVLFPTAYLLDGQNSIVVRTANLVDSVPDRVLLNWLEIEYDRKYIASGGQIAFATSGENDSLMEYNLSGFPSYNIDVYKLGVSKIIGGKVDLTSTGLDYCIKFQDKNWAKDKYLITIDDDEHKLKPVSISPNNPSNLRDAGFNGTQYVVIAPDKFKSQAATIASLRNPRFPGAKVALTSDIYDEFNYGMVSDKAIKDYLTYIYARWEIKPEYVLLLGDGNYDPKNILKSGSQSLIPVHLYRTLIYGGVAGDNYYACVSGDDYIPDIAIGRLPINSTGDFEAWEAKREFYEKREYLDKWHRNIMFVAGWPLNTEDNFYATSNKLAGTVQDKYSITKVYHGDSYQNKEDLICAINDGAAVVCFFGHGGAQLWSHGSFFWYYDVDRLNNWGRWPFIGSFTCNTGAFESPVNISLSEKFLQVSGGGIGVYSSSGASYGDSINGCILENTFVDALNIKGYRNIGDIAFSSKCQMIGSMPPIGQVLDMLTNYNLLGDPALQLALPDTQIDFEVSPKTVYPGDSIDIVISGGFGAGTVYTSITDASGLIISQSVRSCPANTTSYKIVVPDSALSGEGIVKLYLKDENMDWVSAQRIGIGRTFYSDYSIVPSTLTDIDSVMIRVKVNSLNGIDSVRCFWKWGLYSDTLAGFNEYFMVKTVGDTYELQTKLFFENLLGNYYSGAKYYLHYYMLMSDSLGQFSQGNIRHVLIYRRPDITPASLYQGAAFLDGKKRLTLSTKVKNIGDINARTVPIYFYRYGDDSLLGYTIIDTVKVNEEKVVSIPWNIEGKYSQVRYKIDPDHIFAMPYPQEDTTNDLSSVLWVPSQEFYYYQLDMHGKNEDTLNYYDFIKAYLPDSCLEDSAVAIIGRYINNDLKIAQSGLFPIQSMNHVYFVNFTDSSLALKNNKRIKVSLRVDEIDSTIDKKHIGLYRLSENNNTWQYIPSQFDSNYIYGYSEAVGSFMAMATYDSMGPNITAKVDKQALGWGQDILVHRPQYSVLFEDPSGINIDSIWVKKDGQEVSNAEFNITKNPDNPNSVPLIYSPYLKDGMHDIEFGAVDNIGNRSSILLENNVKVEFSLQSLANYPNPVIGDLTTFYFCVGDYADKYELKIYSVAGRLVKTITGGFASGECTFNWDLKNDGFKRVANGVYFYTLKVYQGDKMHSKTEKLAVLR